MLAAASGGNRLREKIVVPAVALIASAATDGWAAHQVSAFPGQAVAAGCSSRLCLVSGDEMSLVAC